MGYKRFLVVTGGDGLQQVLGTASPRQDEMTGGDGLQEILGRGIGQVWSINVFILGLLLLQRSEFHLHAMINQTSNPDNCHTYQTTLPTPTRVIHTTWYCTYAANGRVCGCT